MNVQNYTPSVRSHWYTTSAATRTSSPRGGGLRPTTAVTKMFLSDNQVSQLGSLSSSCFGPNSGVHQVERSLNSPNHVLVLKPNSFDVPYKPFHSSKFIMKNFRFLIGIFEYLPV